jgi:hypothetical protein
MVRYRLNERQEHLRKIDKNTLNSFRHGLDVQQTLVEKWIF